MNGIATLNKLAYTASSIHSNFALEYDRKFQSVIDRLEEEVKARANILGARAGGRLLDYACGTGLLSRVSLGTTLLPRLHCSPGRLNPS